VTIYRALTVTAMSIDSALRLIIDWALTVSVTIHCLLTVTIDWALTVTCSGDWLLTDSD
jgi:hypothetical protein